MTTWNVRVAAGEAPTALILERPDGAQVSEADAAAMYEQLNGSPPTEPNPDRPPNLADGHCDIVEQHEPHVATWHSDDGPDFDYWCSGAAVTAAPAEAGV